MTTWVSEGFRCTALSLTLLGALAFLAPAAPAQPAQNDIELVAPEADAAGEPDAKPAAAAGGIVGWLELSGSLPDDTLEVAWAAGERDPSLRGVLAELERVAKSDQHRGLVIYLDQPALSLAQIAELREGLDAVRAAGKQVLCYSEQYDMHGYLLACAADQILLLRKGTVELTGIAIEEMYLAGLLEKVGLKADFVQVGRYKGAAEPLTSEAPSPEWSQNIDNLLDDLYDQVVRRIAEARGLNRTEVEQAMRDSWTMSDQDYVKRGLIDRLVDRDLVNVTSAVYGEGFTWEELLKQANAAQNMDNPFALFRVLFQGPQQPVRRPSIALVHCYGEIHSGDSNMAQSPRAGLFSSESIGSRTIVELLGDVRDNELIKGVVLRIDSPGGSALASEVMWQAIRDCAQHKPVFISIGSLAASGGYYMACAGDRIYVSPTSIVGSIGVVGGKLVLGELYQKIGVNVTRRGRGPLSDMFNSVEPFNAEQREALASAIDRIYDQFTDRVTTGRERKIADVEAVAQGRLFTGRQAVLNGLADEMGGVETAIADLAKQLNLTDGAYDVIKLPEPKSLAEMLEEIFGGFSLQAPGSVQGAGFPAGALLSGAARELLGPQAWQSTQTTLRGLMLLRHEPTLTLMPVVITIR